MNRQRQKKIWLRLITYVVITAMVCQNMAWAIPNGCISPPNKTVEITTAYNELNLAINVTKILIKHTVLNMHDLWKKIHSIEDDMGNLDRDFRYAVFNRNIYVIRKNILFRFVINGDEDPLYKGLINSVPKLLDTKMGLGDRNFVIQAFRVTKDIEMDLDLMKEFMPGRLRQVIGVSGSRKKNNNGGMQDIPPDLHKRMVRFYKRLKGMRIFEGRLEGNEVGIRDLKMWVGFIRRFKDELGLELSLIKGARYIFADRIEKQKLEQFENILHQEFYDFIIKISSLPRYGESIDFLGDRIRIRDTFLEINPSPNEYVPSRESSELVITKDTPQMLYNVEKAALAIVMNDPVLLIGETGVGKTAICRYLAYLTNNGFRRFNLNGLTDKIEFIGGYKPQPDGSMRWEDGILIKAMQNGDWLLLDEINLAEPEILERINSLLDDERSLVVSEHEGERYVPKAVYEKMVNEGMDVSMVFPIHPNFRILATMNPPDYEGRKVLSPAFMNRFRIKWIEEPPESEMLQILRKKYGFNIEILQKMYQLHVKMKGLSLERRKFTLRDLFRLADRIRNYFGSGLNLIDLLIRETYEVYGDGLGEVKGIFAFKKVLNEVLGRSDYPKMDNKIIRGEDSLVIGDAVLSIHPEDSFRTNVPGDDSYLVPVPTTMDALYKIAKGIQMNEKLLLVGPTGAGKTSFIRYLAHLTNNNFIRVNLDGQTDTSELLGEYIPTGIPGKYEWRDGILIEAMKNGDWILLDEFNLADPEIMERINSLLDDDGYLVLTEHEGKKIRPHPNFRLFSAMNPERYAGRQRISVALRNKLNEKWISGDMPQEELVTIVTHYLTKGKAIEDKIAKGIAIEMVKFHLRIIQEVDDQRLGGKKLGPEAEVDYRFSLRDLKAWANYIKEFGMENLGLSLIKGAVYVYRDRLRIESVEEIERFRHIVSEISFNRFAPIDRQINLDEILEPPYEFRNRLERIVRGEVTGEEAGDVLFILTQGYPKILEKPIKEIARWLSSSNPMEKIEGISALHLFPDYVGGKILEALMRDFKWHHADVKLALIEFISKRKGYVTREIVSILIGNFDIETDIIKMAIIKSATYFPKDYMKMVMDSVLKKFGRLNDNLRLKLIYTMADMGLLRDEDYSDILRDILVNKKYSTHIRAELLRLIIEHNVRFGRARWGFNLIGFLNMFLKVRPSLYKKYIPEKWDVVKNIISIASIFICGFLGFLNPDILIPAFEILRKIGIFIPVDWFTSGILGIAIGSILSLIINPIIKFINFYSYMISLSINLRLSPDELLELYFEEQIKLILPQISDKLVGYKDTRLFLENYERMVEVTARNIKMWEEEAQTGKVTKDAYDTGRIEVSSDGKMLKILDTSIPIKSDKIEEEVRSLTLNRSTLENLEKIGQAVVLGDPVLLIGETGVGKTSLVRYLAYLTGNTFRRFNLNGQTDKLEFIGGYRPTPDGGLEWHDGILIEAMKNGYWLLLDEINLAEPQVLERINSLLDEDGYIILREHRGEKIKPHPDFRLFSAMNPSEYMGRNLLSPAFMNRFRVKWITEPLQDEILGILLDRYFLDEKKGQKLDDLLMAKVVLFHKAMQELANDRVIGADEQELYHYTLRNLLRLMDRVAIVLSERKASGDISEGEIVKIVATQIRCIYGDMIRSQLDQDVFKNLLSVYFGVDKGEGEVDYEIQFDSEGVKVGEIRLQKRPSDIEITSYIPGESSVLTNVPTTNGYLHKIVEAVRTQGNILLVGPTGSSKTSLIRYLAYLTNNNFVRVNLDTHTDTSELMGEYIPTGQKGVYKWKDGILIEAMKNGYWLLLDEFNLAEPEIIERINSLLDDDRYIILTEHNGERIKPHPNFRLFCAMNPPEYKGRNRLSIALRNKFTEIWIPGDFKDEELIEIVMGYLDNNLIKDSNEREELATEMVKLYRSIEERFTQGLTGDELATLTIRDIKSHAGFINRFAPSLGIKSAYTIGAHYVYRERLSPTGTKEEFEKLLPKMKEKKIFDTIIQSIEKNPIGGELVPPKEIAELVMTEKTREDMKSLACAVALREPILLVGETGVGKTSLVRYLAYFTNNNLRRFNLNGQTDKFEFLGGYRPQPDGSIKWEDGILIRAMKNGDWIILDEINLAEPQVLERINSLLDDDGYIVLREHEGEKIKPHPNFRLFATMNPSEYSGRKELSKAMINRFRIKWIDEPGVEELKVILEQRYGQRFSRSDLYKILNIHKATKNISEDRKYTIRDLMKLANRVLYRREKIGKDYDFSSILHEEADEIYGTTLSEEFKPYNIEKKDGKVIFGDIELDIKEGDGNGVPGEDSILVPVETTLRYLRKIAKAIAVNERPLLIGKTGTGKTALIRYLAHLTNTRFVRLNLDGQTDTAELVGEYVPGPQKGSYIWRDGVLVDAMKKGYWILLDEVNLAEPDILERINSLLDDDSKLIITEHEGEVVRPHPDFRLFCAMNPPEGYSGRKILSLAFQNKVTIMNLPDEFQDDELEYIVGAILGMDVEYVPKIKVTTHPSHDESRGGKAKGVSSITTEDDEPLDLSKPPRGKGYDFAKPHLPKKVYFSTSSKGEEKDLGMLDKYRLWKKKRQVAKIIEAIAKATGGDVRMKVIPGERWSIFYDTDPVTITYPMDEFLKEDIDVIIGQALHEAGHRKISYASSFVFEKETRRLLFNVVEDPRANNWQTEVLRGAREYIAKIYKDWPEELQIEYTDEDVLPHEQFADGIIYWWIYGKVCPYIKNKKVIEALEKTKDAFVEAYSILPGSMVKMKNEGGKLYFHTEEGDLVMEIPKEGARVGFIPNTNISVKVESRGLITLKTPIGLRLLKIPGEGEEVKILASVEPSERDIKLAGQRSGRIVKERILPIYEELVVESKKIVEKMIRDGKIQIGVGKGEQIPSELISEEASKCIEERAKGLADKLQGKIEGGDVREAKKEAEEARVVKPKEEKKEMPVEEKKVVKEKPEEGVEKPEEEKEAKPGEVPVVEKVIPEEVSMTEMPKPEREMRDIPRRVDDEEAFRELLKAEREKERIRKEALKERIEEEYVVSRYDDWRRPISNLIRRLVGFLENILRKDTRPKYKGSYRTGRKLNLRRIMQLDRKIKEDLPLTSEDYKVMLRKTRPVKRNHKFAIILDESGSMAGGQIEKDAISALIMFMEALSLLNIDFSVIGFHTSYVPHKEFKERADFKKREEIIREVTAAMGRGCTNDTLAVKVALDDILKEPATDRTIIVITDGCGNGIGAMEPILKEAEREGVKVIGIGIGLAMEYVKSTYKHARTCRTLDEVPEELASVLVEEVFTKEPRGKYLLQRIRRGKKTDYASFADSHINVEKDGIETNIDEGVITPKGMVKGLTDPEKEAMLNKVHEVLGKIYGERIFRFVKGVRIKRNISYGGIAHYQDDYIDYDERLFSSIPSEYETKGWDISYLALLFEQAEHELLESILCHHDISSEIREITVILQNLYRFFNPNRGVFTRTTMPTLKGFFNKEKYQNTILGILGKDEENGIDPDERYRRLILEIAKGGLSKKEIIISIARYIMGQERYADVSSKIGDISRRNMRKRIIRDVLRTEKKLYKVLGVEKTIGIWGSFVNWISSHLEFNPRYLSIGAISMIVVILLRIFALPLFSTKLTTITYSDYYNHRALYYLQRSKEAKDKYDKKENLILALNSIYNTFLYSPDNNARENALKILDEMNMGIKKLIFKVLFWEDFDVSHMAKGILLEIGPSVVPYILEEMKNMDSFGRAWLAEILIEMYKGRYGDKVKKELEKRLGPKYEERLRYYIYISDGKWDEFVRLGKDGVRPLLIAVSDWRGFLTRDEIKASLLKIGEKGVDPLIDALDDENTDIRNMSAEVLMIIMDKAEQRLKERLGPDYERIIRAYNLIRWWKWDELREIGGPAIKPLIQFINDQNNLQSDRAKADQILKEIRTKMYNELLMKIKSGSLTKEEILREIQNYLSATGSDEDLFDVFNELIKSIPDLKSLGEPSKATSSLFAIIRGTEFIDKEAPTVLAIDTEIGPIEQQGMLFPLYKAICEIKFDGLYIIRGKGSELASKIKGLDIEPKNLIVIGKNGNLQKGYFESIRSENTFILGVDDLSLESNNYVPILEIITLALAVFEGKDIEAIKRIYKDITRDDITEDDILEITKNRLIVILPKPVSIEIKELRDIYNRLANEILSSA